MSEIATSTQSHAVRALGLLTEATDAGGLRAPHPGCYDDRGVALRDAQAGAGHALLAICQELAQSRVQAELEHIATLAEVAAMRRDLRDITAAIRELSGAIGEATVPVAGALVDVSNAIADVRTELAETGDVAAAVRELADPAPECGCAWQGGAPVETCPDHNLEAFRARLETPLRGRRRWWRWGR
ncbi:hypothetical protein [Sphaerisporangium fuscum]|uniref:hypothetical protein n=1 Tax=Sphaerisporangium fuscum TaxID=2835868 RepID=UPI001BDD0430|nr:hypothetical protein [Sphaerisporangium fuscum]